MNTIKNDSKIGYKAKQDNGNSSLNFEPQKPLLNFQKLADDFNLRLRLMLGLGYGFYSKLFLR